MKKIKYTPDAADKLRALKSAISGEYGGDKAKKIIKSITDAIRGLCDYEEKGPEVSKMFDVVSDYRYIFVSRNYVLYRNISEKTSSSLRLDTVRQLWARFFSPTIIQMSLKRYLTRSLK